jgi:glycosyltransferase involved in cell wall biosynthesis
MPEVTVYIPTKNRSALLLRAVSSVLSQTHEDWELIVVDDNSTDETPVFLERLAALDPRIKFFRQSDSLGGCAARNLAISHASGTFIAGLDDDDMFLPTRLEELLKPAREGYPVICGCDLFWSRRGLRKIWRPRRITYPMQVTRNYLGNQILTRTNYIQAVGGFDTSLSALQDYDVWNRLVKRYGDGMAVQSFNHIIFGNDHVARISTNREKQIDGFMKFYDKHSADMSWRDKHLHIARRLVLTSRSSAMWHALLGADFTVFGLKEFLRLATVNPLR